MEIFIFLIISHILIDKTRCMQIRPIGLEILPESKTNGQNILLRRAEETLNLTCRVVAGSLEDVHDLPRYKLTWHFPQLNSQNRVVEEELHNARVLTIENLKETDAGDYACRAELATPNEKMLFNETVRVHVKKRCGEQMFTCPAGVCIARRYVCDGKADCKDGADEHEQNCGMHACEGKIMCAEEGRCIPKNWCCDQHTQPNCTAKMKLPCCPNNKRYSIPDFTDMSEQQRFSDMGFLQTTIYTVIGCAMAFMFIVTILVIAICRVHMKRSLLSRCPNSRTGRAANRGRATQPLYDLDVFLNRSSFPSDAHSGLLVTYNINNGIQFVGRPVDPPPYCEVVASPPREGPPPPYASHENLTAPASASQDSAKALAPCPDLPGPGQGPGPGQTREIALTSGEVEPLLGTRESPGNTLTITTVVSTMPRSKETRRAASRSTRPMPLVKSASLSLSDETGSGPAPGRLRESFIGLRRERERDREAPERAGDIGRGQGSSKE